MWLSDFGNSKAGREPQRGRWPGTIFWGNHGWSQTWMEWGIERQKSLEEDHVRLRRCPWKGWEATDIRRDRIMHVWMCQEPAGITRRKESTGSACPGRVTAAITRPPPLPVPSRLSGKACAARFYLLLTTLMWNREMGPHFPENYTLGSRKVTQLDKIHAVI